MQFKLCPFCGGNEIHFQTRTVKGTNTDLDGVVFHYVMCFDCDCRTGDYSDEDATEAYGYTGENTGKQLALVSWNLRK
jgi:hypothetical protein